MYMNMFAIPLHGVNMTVKEDVIKAMKEAGKPMSAGEVEKATGIDRKEIDKAFKELKAEGAIITVELVSTPLNRFSDGRS